LARCLDAIGLLDYPRDGFEVVVVSDEANSTSVTIAVGHLATLPLRVVNQDHSGPARARNTGAAATTGEFLLFLDDDCAPAPDWLRQWDLHASRHPGSAAGGGTRNALRNNLYSSATHALVEYMQQSSDAGKSDLAFLASNNLCLPADRFRALGGFSTTFPLAAAEDRDFCDRWRTRGWPLLRAELAVVHHAHQLTFSGFWRQQRNYGRGAFQLHRERLARNQLAGIGHLEFYVNLILFPWNRENPWRALLLSTLLVLAQVASATGYAGEWRRGLRR
jgi:glycosyltransferase involved in cell wall biosynthesis